MSIEADGFNSSKVFKQLHAQLDSLSEEKRKDLVKKVKGVFEIELKNSSKKTETWSIDMKSGTGTIAKGSPKAKSDAKISMNDNDFVSLSTGKLNSQRAFLQGKLKVKGQMMLATKLDNVLKQLTQAPKL